MKPGDTHGLCLWLRSTGAILGSGLLEVNVSGVMGQGATSLQSSLYRLWLTDLEATHRLHSSSFLGLPYRLLNMSPEKELLWSLWVEFYSLVCM